MNFDYEKSLIYLHLAGSRSYGTNTAESDYDYRGIIVPPKSYFKGFLHHFEEKHELAGYGKDSVGYDIRKFFKLCADNNPNILEGLFVRPQDQIIKTKYSEKLIASRGLFLSKASKDRFGGYAFKQLSRMKSHREFWVKERNGLSPTRPLRSAFGLPEEPRWTNSDVKRILVMNLNDLSEDIREEVSNERRYRAALAEFEQWETWRTNRNKIRYELEEKYGYDCKFAYHLVRLLKISEEILKEGTFSVYRPDREELMIIRNGGWSYEKLMEWNTEQEIKLNGLYEKSTLQEHAQFEKINELCIEIVEDIESQE